MAAENMAGARQTPLFAAFPKMFMPFVVILPGIAAVALMGCAANASYEARRRPRLRSSLTTLMAQFYPSGMLGIGLTALDGFVHVGYGGKCDCIQHGIHI